jgi:SAM-dependent methyltransferase
MLRSILPERDPLTHVERKVWEFAMVALLLEELGLLNESTEALSVGAGDERIIYWLANRIGRMVATDVYGEGGFAGNEAERSMLEDPASHAPFPYREDRLEVMWMDARELSFADDSFDVVFTLSSIEHFGSPQDVARAAAEIGRVLKPGGYAIVVTECLVRLHPLDSAPVELGKRIASLGTKMRTATISRRVALAETFTPHELAARIVQPSGLRLAQPLDLTISSASWENLTAQSPNGQLTPRTGTKYPMILMKVNRSVFTSVCLVMGKPSG